MTRTTRTAPRTTLPSLGQPQSRSNSPAVINRADDKQRKRQSWAFRLFSPKNNLDVDFSLKDHTGVRVDEVEVEEVSEGTGRHPIGDTSVTQAHSQVQLADLLVPPRRPRKGKDADFEVVPHIRSVIVLDDNTTPDLEVDEPWEHVFAAEVQTVNVPSYAKVASLT